MAKRKRKRRAWSDAEIEFLRRNYGPLSAKQIAIRLDRPEISVHKKIKALNIQKYSGLIKPKICFEDVLAGWIPGDRVRVTLPSIPGLKSDSAPGRGKSRRTHTGLVLQVHKRYILVQLPGWRECVNVGTVIAGEAQIELLERGKVA